MSLEYTNLRKIKGNFIWRVDSKFLSNHYLKSKFDTSWDKKSIKKLEERYKEFSFHKSGYETRNKFLIWFSRVRDWDNQRDVKVKYNINPTKTYEDKENQNIVDFFDFSSKLNKKFHLKIDFSFDFYETKLKTKPQITKYNRNSHMYKRYTKSERYLEQTKEIKRLSKNIVKKEKGHFNQARRIFDWILDNISYKYPPEDRGVIPTLKNKSGDCGEFNHLFITLCRSLGIPARSVFGMWSIPKSKKHFHAWCEFYLEDVGWIPADPSVAQGVKFKDDKRFITFIKSIKNPLDFNYYFGNLDNKRIIFCKGNNILLKYCPKKLSKLKFMENCRTLGMQPASAYPFIGGNKKGIFIVKIEPELNISVR